MHTAYLMIDEILDLLRSTRHGANIRTADGAAYAVYHSASYEDGIVVPDTKYIDLSTGYRVNRTTVIDAIYDAVRSGRTATIDGQNVLDI